MQPITTTWTFQQWECPQCSRVCTLAPGLPEPSVCADCWNSEVGIALLDIERIAADYVRLDDLTEVVQTLASSQAQPPVWLVKELAGMWERACSDSSTVPKEGSRLQAMHDEVQNVSYDLLAKLGLDVWEVHLQYRTFDSYWRKEQLVKPPSLN